MANAFEAYLEEAWPHKYLATLLVTNIAGGIPADPRTIKKFIESKVKDTDDRIRQLIAETMAARGATYEEAVDIISDETSVNGFKKDDQGLYIEGRQVKAMLKEAANIAALSKKLPAKIGVQNGPKGPKGGKIPRNFVAEHVFVMEDKIHLGVDAPSGTYRGFTRAITPKGPISAIKQVDYVEEAKLRFHVVTDHEFEEREWAMIWLTAGQNGLGADRSQGFGRFTVEEWTKVH